MLPRSVVSRLDEWPGFTGAQRAATALLLLAGASGLLAGCRQAAPPVQVPVAGKLLLNGVTVVDVRNGELMPQMSVLLDQGKILSVTPAASAASAAVDASIKVVDATGKFVVPGYNDMHAHPLGFKDPSGTLALMLANGITGFRQMQGSSELLKQRREGTLPITRYSPALLAMPGDILLPLNAGTVKRAVQTVRVQKEEGADFIKAVYTSPAVFMAALAEAQRVGLPFAGHLQDGVDAVQAAQSGMKSIEHLGPGDTLLVSCSTDERTLREEIAKKSVPGGPPFKVPDFVGEMVAKMMHKKILNPLIDNDLSISDRWQRAAATFNEGKCRTMAAQFVAHQTWQVPTLIRLKTMELADAHEFVSDPHQKFMPADILQGWNESLRDYTEHVPAATKASYRSLYAMQMKLVKLFDDAGVKMLAGSDLGGVWVIPGFSLHQEFDELERAGLSPLHVLQMTTLNAAEFLGKTSTMGSVVPGSQADLVVLDANPLDSVQNLHKVNAVVRAGFYYGRSDLDDLENKVQAGGGLLPH